MPEQLKNVYSQDFFNHFTGALKEVVPAFDKPEFLNQVFDGHWQQRELKQRMRHISTVLHQHLPGEYRHQIHYILKLVAHLQETGLKENSFPYMFLPDFIEQYGLGDLTTSLNAMEVLTQFISCEFAIRPFLLKYPAEVIAQMLKWSRHKSHLVRRFSSEGCRPRLPWAMAIPQLKKDPSPIVPILENLKADPSLFVRKSVANNLNDIAKDNPEVVIQLAKKWKGVSAETDRIVRHGCRTLLKKADENTYTLFGLNAAANCSITNFKLAKSKIKIGEQLHFSFDLKLIDGKTDKLRIEYAIYYVKSNGSQSRKLFKLTENNFEGCKVYSFNRYQRFQDFTTRKHYPGKHKIGIVVNGKELATSEFDVTAG